MQVNCSDAVIIVTDPENLEKLEQMIKEFRSMLDAAVADYADIYYPLPTIIEVNGKQFAAAGFGQNILPCREGVFEYLLGVDASLDDEGGLGDFFAVLTDYGIEFRDIVLVACVKDDVHPTDIQHVYYVRADVGDEEVKKMANAVVKNLWFRD